MIFAVRGDDIFEAEHLPSYARTYILPRQMVRMLEYSLNEDNTFTDFSFVKLPKRRKMPMVIQLSVSPSQVYNVLISPKMLNLKMLKTIRFTCCVSEDELREWCWAGGGGGRQEGERHQC